MIILLDSQPTVQLRFSRISNVLIVRLVPGFFAVRMVRISSKSAIDSTSPLRLNNGDVLEEDAAMISNFTGIF
jgi:hypothetical protein